MVVSNDAKEIQVEGWVKVFPAELASRRRLGLGET